MGIRNWFPGVTSYNKDPGLTYARGTEAVKDTYSYATTSQGRIEFAIINCHGGYLIETVKYGREHGETRLERYVIDENADLGEEVSKIVGMINLRG